MALGIHWEWRGFGILSSEFAFRYSALEPQFPRQSVEDRYLWAPKLEVNVKVRDIPAEPFKFKRLLNKDGHLEQWAERPSDIYRFPLDKVGWEALAGTMAAADLVLGPYPAGTVDAERTLAELERAGARTVTVHKQRASRLWPGPNGQVKVEWACILSPQPLITIGLETWDADPEGPGLSDEQAKADIRAAIQALGLHDEPLKALNYVEAVAVWATGRTIS
ncbi:MAG: hypothetical protein PVF77_01770 [Anaerolineae bacterium]|jgi:hypothetical protein